LSGAEQQPEPKQQSIPPESAPLPGEFVSEELRGDTARFLDELHRRVGSRDDSNAPHEQR
jgi:hypothetical protein